MPELLPRERRALDVLAHDLERVFGPRLGSLVAYRGHHADGPVHSCAIVDRLQFADLAACLPLTDAWHRHGLAVPLLLSRGELERTLGSFPLEYASIAADHVVIRGRDPFASLTIADADIRRACETQSKSHLIHLREGYLESHGEVRAISRLIAHSAAPLRTLLTNLVRLLNGGGAVDDRALAAFAEARLGVSAALVRDVFAMSGNQATTVVDPSALFARYLDAAETIWRHADQWRDVEDARRAASDK